MEPTPRKVIHLSKKRVIIVGIIIIIVLWGLFNLMGILTGVKTGGSVAAPCLPGWSIDNLGRCTPGSSGSGAMMGLTNPGGSGDSAMMYPNYQGNNPTVEDTREFLKTSYSATIKSRDVSKTVRDVKSVVRDFDGRIDQTNSSEKYGYVSFVVEKDKFDSFRDEIENLTHRKLYTENVSSQNLLSQKQVIEQQTNSATDLYTQLIQNKKSIDLKHTQTIASINKELASVANDLTIVRTTISVVEDPDQLVALRNQEATLVNRQISLKQQQTAENNNYTNQIASINNQIDNATATLDNLDAQDTQFTNTVETVTGTINVNFISLWEMAKIFSPVHPTIIILVLCLIALWSFLKKGPKIELV